MARARLLLVAVLGASVALAGCAQQEPADDGGASELVTEVTIEGTEWSLSPGDAAVPAGEKVTITFENAGSNQHNVGVDLDGDGETEDDARTETIPRGESATFTVTIDEPGEYAFYCDISGHRSAGMVGTLTVR